MSGRSKILQDKETIANIFHTNVIDFIDSIIEVFQNSPKLIVARMLVKTSTPVKITETFIKSISPYSLHIKSKDPEFFECVNMGFFSDGTLQELWKSESLSEDDREAIWTWFQLFNVLSEKYTKIA